VIALIKPPSPVLLPASAAEPKAALGAASLDSAEIMAKVQRMSRKVTSEEAFDEHLARLVPDRPPARKPRSIMHAKLKL